MSAVALHLIQTDEIDEANPTHEHLRYTTHRCIRHTLGWKKEVPLAGSRWLYYSRNPRSPLAFFAQVKRRELAMSAREKYQKGKDPREVRGKTLSYAEFDLP